MKIWGKFVSLPYCLWFLWYDNLNLCLERSYFFFCSFNDIFALNFIHWILKILWLLVIRLWVGHWSFSWSTTTKCRLLQKHFVWVIRIRGMICHKCHMVLLRIIDFVKLNLDNLKGVTTSQVFFYAKSWCVIVWLDNQVKEMQLMWDGGMIILWIIPSLFYTYKVNRGHVLSHHRL